MSFTPEANPVLPTGLAAELQLRLLALCHFDESILPVATEHNIQPHNQTFVKWPKWDDTET